MGGATQVSDSYVDLNWLRETIGDSVAAAKEGIWPYSALIVGAEGLLLSRVTNSVVADGDPTAHAEIIAIREACRKHRGPAILAGATMYASVEPCAMCAGGDSLERP